MGGRALKTVNCIRIHKEQYNNIKENIIQTLSKYVTIHEIYQLPDKKDFGDLDLLYMPVQQGQDVYAIIKSVFNPKEIVSNGNVISFSYNINEIEHLQVDLIKTYNIDMALLYFSYGLYGALVGRMVKPYDLTFGDSGLWIVYKNEKIILSSIPSEICTYLGLDYCEWKKGFSTNMDIIQHLIKCKYFTTANFRSDKLNNDYRTMIQRRPFFNEFMAYISNIPPTIIENDRNYIAIFNKFKEKEKIDVKDNIIKLYQQKYNGLIFMKYTEPKMVNILKEGFKQNKEKTVNFEEWLYDATNEQIEEEIKEYIHNIVNKKE